MISWAYIFEAPETDPAIDRMVIERGGLRTTVVAVHAPAEAVRVAVELVDSGVQFIELCGSFGPAWAGKVAEATDGRAPIGIVGYAGERDIARMASIFSPAGPPAS